MVPYKKVGKPKVCKATKGDHIKAEARIHTAMMGKYLWVEWKCLCGKKDLEFSKKNESYESVLARLKDLQVLNPSLKIVSQNRHTGLQNTI